MKSAVTNLETATPSRRAPYLAKAMSLLGLVVAGYLLFSAVGEPDVVMKTVRAGAGIILGLGAALLWSYLSTTDTCELPVSAFHRRR